MIITPSSTGYDTLAPHDLCSVHIEDGTVKSGSRPSSETPMHRAVYAATSAGAIVHTHPPMTVALSSILESLPAVHYALAVLGGPVRVVPYARFGTEELAELAVRGLEDRTAVILGNHGALTYGSTVSEAYERTLVLEWLASVYWHASVLSTPRLLDEQQLAEVAGAHYGRYEGRG
jgi:L-fuculose-phosphate aldolase